MLEKFQISLSVSGHNIEKIIAYSYTVLYSLKIAKRTFNKPIQSVYRKCKLLSLRAVHLDWACTHST